MQLRIALFIISAALFWAGCSIPKVDVTDSTGAFNYSLNENGCQTGNHNFRSREEMCDGLRNDSLNNYCAQTLRYQKFQNDCPDRTWN